MDKLISIRLFSWSDFPLSFSFQDSYLLKWNSPSNPPGQSDRAPAKSKSVVIMEKWYLLPKFCHRIHYGAWHICGDISNATYATCWQICGHRLVRIGPVRSIGGGAVKVGGTVVGVPAIATVGPGKYWVEGGKDVVQRPCQNDVVFAVQ